MAVYTRLLKEQAQQIITRYGLGELVEIHEIAEGIENSNFLITTAHDHHAVCHILTLFEKRTDPQDLPFFLGLMEHLSRAGIPCPMPLHTQHGKLTFEHQDKQGTIVSFLGGKSKLAAQATEANLVQLGTMIGKMHLATKNFHLTRPNNLSVTGWKHLIGEINTRADEIEKGLSATLQSEIAFLEKHWREDLPSGIIHADIFPDNVFFKDDTLSGIIDFYFSCHDSFAYEMAIMLNAWCFDAQHVFQANKAKALLNAYQQIRPLSQQETDTLPILCRGAALRFLLTRAYDWINHDTDALVTRKDPIEYVLKLKYWSSATSNQWSA